MRTVLVLNGSPRREQSGTLMLAQAFVAGLTEDGAWRADSICISDLRVTPCRGCLSCWRRPDGACAIEGDDVAAVRGKIEAADVVVLSAPLYFFGLPGEVKLLVDRLLGMLATYRGQEMPQDGSSCHGIRRRRPGQHVVFVSSCAWMEVDAVYASLFMQLDMVLGRGGYTPLVVPQLHTLVQGKAHRTLSVLVERFRRAGRELAQGGSISPETARRISTPQIAGSVYRQLLSRLWPEEA